MAAMGPERLPPLAAHDLSDQQRSAIDVITAGPRGGIVGPFVALLRHPALLVPLQEIGVQLRFSGMLDRGVFELAVLQVAAHWRQEFEWNFHAPLAVSAGVPLEALRQLDRGTPVTGLLEPLASGYGVVEELLREHTLSDATFARGVDRFGEPGLIELVVATGYYTTLAMVMNAARTAPGDAAVPVALAPR